MTDAPLATPEELASYMQSDLDRSTAELALDITSGSIRRACGWSISQQIDVVWTLDGSGTTTLFLPTLKLIGVTSVSQAGVLLTDYEWSATGVLHRLYGQYWTAAARGIVVTAVHGYNPVPDDIKGACLEHSARTMASPEGGLRSYTVGNVSETFSPSSVMHGIDNDPRVAAYRIPALG